MRLFTGIALAGDVPANLEKVLAELRPLAPARWSPVENLHITGKFIGEWPEERLPELRRALEGVPVPPPFAVTIARFGYYPNPHHPKVLFATIQAGAPELAALAQRIDEALTPLGAVPEARPYRPHLTLARIGNENMRAVREHIANMTNFDFGTFQAAAFHLYLSRPQSVYTKLATFSLGSQVGSPA